MTANFRSLCKQLADDLSLWVECQVPPTDLPHEQANSFRLLCQTYKALSENKPLDIESIKKQED